MSGTFTACRISSGPPRTPYGLGIVSHSFVCILHLFSPFTMQVMYLGFYRNELEHFSVNECKQCHVARLPPSNYLRYFLETPAT